MSATPDHFTGTECVKSLWSLFEDQEQTSCVETSIHACVSECSQIKLERLHGSEQCVKHNDYETDMKLPFKGNEQEARMCR